MKQRQYGVSLVEVLVALAILAIALGSVLASVAHTTHTVQRVQQRIFSSWDQDNAHVLTALQTRRQPPSSNSSS